MRRLIVATLVLAALMGMAPFTPIFPPPITAAPPAANCSSNLTGGNANLTVSGTGGNFTCH